MIEALMNHVWQSTVFAGAAGLLTLTLRKNGAHTRYWLWCAASCKFLIPFSVLIAVGSHLGWRSTPTVPFTPVLAHFVQPFQPTAAGAPIAAMSPATGESISPLLILIGAWLCGTVVVGIYWMVRWLRVREVVSRAKPLRLDTPIPVRSSQILIEPGLVGLFRPVLLLPDGIFERLTPQQLRAILAHEVCHLRRRDNLTAAIHMLVETLFWFHPLVWWLGRRLIVEREAACDETVIGAGYDRVTYAEGLLAVCKLYLEWPPVCVSGIMSADLKKRIVRIMTQRLVGNLTFGRKLLLVAIGIAAVAGPVVFGLRNASQVRAQSPQSTVESLLSFEVASIKPSRPGDDAIRLWMSPGRFTTEAETMKEVIEFAYDIKSDNQLSGGPNWINSKKYDIEAKEGDSSVERLEKLPPDRYIGQVRLMVRGLLADRFKLKVRRETKQLPVYALVLAKNGPKLKQTAVNSTAADGANPWSPKEFRGIRMVGRGQLSGTDAPIGLLTDILARQPELGRLVLNETGLKDNYDWTLKWIPDKNIPMFKEAGDGSQATANAPSPDSSGSSIFAAIQEQLGLKLESQEGPVEVLVINSVEAPSEN